MRCLLGVLTVFAFGGPCIGQKEPRPPLPKTLPPLVVFATASVNEGKVELQLLVPINAMLGVEREVEVNGVRQKATVVSLRPERWQSLPLEVNNKDVQVFDLGGHVLTPEQVAKKLEKLTPLVVFQDEDPDPHYLRVLREDTLVLKAPAKRINPPPRPKD